MKEMEVWNEESVWIEMIMWKRLRDGERSHSSTHANYKQVMQKLKDKNGGRS